MCVSSSYATDSRPHDLFLPTWSTLFLSSLSLFAFDVGLNHMHDNCSCPFVRPSLCLSSVSRLPNVMWCCVQLWNTAVWLVQARCDSHLSRCSWPWNMVLYLVARAMPSCELCVTKSVHIWRVWSSQWHKIILKISTWKQDEQLNSSVTLLSASALRVMNSDVITLTLNSEMDIYCSEVNFAMKVPINFISLYYRR